MTRSAALFDGYLFDLDGCVYHGEDPAPGARDLLESIRGQGKQVAFLSNNSTHSAEELAAKLRSMGIEARAEELFIPTRLAGDYLHELFGISSVLVLGSAQMVDAIHAAGHCLASDAEPACQVVFLARDLGFSYEKLQMATRHLQNGATLVAANPDAFHPGRNGWRVPETGALLAALTAASSQGARILGKPEPYLFLKALAYLNLPAGRVLMVGDNLLTDIQGAHNLGLESVWISGDPAPVLAPGGIRPWRTCAAISELLPDFR